MIALMCGSAISSASVTSGVETMLEVVVALSAGLAGAELLTDAELRVDVILGFDAVFLAVKEHSVDAVLARLPTDGLI